jgi:hypothetical protein
MKRRPNAKESFSGASRDAIPSRELRIGRFDLDEHDDAYERNGLHMLLRSYTRPFAREDIDSMLVAA